MKSLRQSFLPKLLVTGQLSITVEHNFFLHTISLRFLSFLFRDFGEVMVIEMVVDYCGYWIFNVRRSEKSCHKNLYPLLCKYDILLHAFYAFCPKTFRILYSISFGERM